MIVAAFQWFFSVRKHYWLLLEVSLVMADLSHHRHLNRFVGCRNHLCWSFSLLNTLTLF